MMKASIITAMAAMSLLSAARVPGDEPKDYSALIEQATACLHRGLQPSEAEVKAAERAMSQLLEEKEAVATFIIGRLRSYRVPDAPAALSSAHYGTVLRQFGPEYVRRLEPAVLKAPGEPARVAGANILGGCSKPETLRKTSVDLLVGFIKRDNAPVVQAAAIQAFGNLRAVDRSELVAKYLSSEHPEVRRAAVGFFWSFPTADVFDRLEAMLDAEEDLEAAFLLAWTVCRYDKLPAHRLLTHRNVGIRCGALHYLAQGSVHCNEEDRAAVAGLLGAETDPRCQYEMAECYRKWKDPRCLGLFISILNGPEDPNRFRGGSVKTAVATALANLTDLQCGVTHEDRVRAREGGGCIYDGLAARASAWWRDSKDRLAWSQDQSNFAVVTQATHKDAQPLGRGAAEARAPHP